jgi:hypothetical protein
MSDTVFRQAQRAHEEPPEESDAVAEWLEGKPVGVCCWCGEPLKETYYEDPHLPDQECENCDEWDVTMIESDNRLRYAAQMIEHEEAAAKMGGRD